MVQYYAAQFNGFQKTVIWKNSLKNTK